MIKISVVMPVYNKEMYLDKTLQCILNQSYKNFEVIIVNDGSTDNTKKICDEYAKKDSRISVYHIENGGVSNARNTGLKYITGEYIQFIDADDCINDGIFEKYVSILDDESYDILFSTYNKVDCLGNILTKVDVGYYGKYMKGQVLSDFVKKQVDTGYYGCVSNKLIKKDIISKNKLQFNKKISLAEDFDFFLDVYRYSNNYYFIDFNSFNYLQNTENSSMLLYDNLDYYIQLLINIKMKEFIVDSGYYYGDNKKILEQRILDYVYYDVFYSKLNKDIIKQKVTNLYNDHKVMKELVIKNFLSFKNIIVLFITKNKYNTVYNILYLRSKLRNFIKRVYSGRK